MSLAAGVAHAQATEAAPAGAQAGAAPQIMAPPTSFSIMAIDVQGVTRLSPQDIEKTIYPFLGPDKKPADVEAARKAVEEAYKKAGFEAADVSIPPQPQEEFAAGLVRISVIEAPVAKVAVSGAKHHGDKLVLQQLPSVKAGEPLNFKTFQGELERANRFPDREVVPSFDAGEQPGTINVDLKVRDSLPFHASAELNNDHSPSTTDLRATGSLRYSNLWGVGHTLSLGYSVAPRRRSDSEAYFGSYSIPFLGSDWTFVLSGYHSNSNIAALGGTNVLGNGYQIGGQVVYRLPNKRDYQAFRIGADFKNFKQNIGLDGSDVSQAPIRYIPLTLGYDYSAARDDWSVDLSVGATLGLRVIKRIECFDPTATTCQPEDQFTNREVDSSENFSHLNLDASVTTKIVGDLVGFLKLSAQFSDSHLVSNEQFAVGGLSSVRGYYQSEVVGDRGLATTVELRSPSLATQLGRFVDEARFFVFVDAGIVSVIDPLPDTKVNSRILSYGGGLRVKLLKLLSGEVLVGVPLRTSADTRANDPRITFQVKGEF
ncbi:MAG TPA: ShlB/FhaC/HecB family hemolysin secretion/activation protein [Novosphingobium sp.]